MDAYQSSVRCLEVPVIEADILELDHLLQHLVGLFQVLHFGNCDTALLY